MSHGSEAAAAGGALPEARAPRGRAKAAPRSSNTRLRDSIGEERVIVRARLSLSEASSLVGLAVAGLRTDPERRWRPPPSTPFRGRPPLLPGRASGPADVSAHLCPARRQGSIQE